MTLPLHFHPPIIAHRGASGYAPENTIVAFTKAAQLGIQWIEFDVMQAACGEPIIFHDDLLDRTTNGRGDISHFPYSYLQTLDAGSWFNPIFSGERIPSFKQILDFLENTKLCANIEIKALPGYEEPLVRTVLKELEQAQLTHSTILFSSFSLDALKFLRQYSPSCLLGLLLHEWEPNWQQVCRQLNCVSVHVNHEIMNKDKASEIKMMGKSLLCYTVNQPKEAMTLFSWGVDAVFSDVPDKILKAVTETKK